MYWGGCLRVHWLRLLCERQRYEGRVGRIGCRSVGMRASTVVQRDSECCEGCQRVLDHRVLLDCIVAVLAGEVVAAGRIGDDAVDRSFSATTSEAIQSQRHIDAVSGTLHLPTSRLGRAKLGPDHCCLSGLPYYSHSQCCTSACLLTGSLVARIRKLIRRSILTMSDI